MLVGNKDSLVRLFKLKMMKLKLFVKNNGNLNFWLRVLIKEKI